MKFNLCFTDLYVVKGDLNRSLNHELKCKLYVVKGDLNRGLNHELKCKPWSIIHTSNKTKQ